MMNAVRIIRIVIEPEFMLATVWTALFAAAFLWFSAVGWINIDTHKTGRDAQAWNSLVFFLPFSLIIYLCIFRKKNPENKSEESDESRLELVGENHTRLSSSRLHDDRHHVINSVENLLCQALDSRSTDIHLEPQNGHLVTRLRIDGLLQKGPSFSHELGLSILSRLKVLAKIDIAEKKKPQDGSFTAKAGGDMVSFRVSTTASLNGETMTIRVLDPERGLIDIEKLGFLPEIEEKILSLISSSKGMILVTGPSGSGKTTTLYAMLNKLNTEEKNIISVEEPVEYELHNVTQIAINPKAGIDFAGSIRSILRHDPNVIMVGEIRDMTTAELAVRISLTGHLVLSTLHSQDAPGVIARLSDMKIEPRLISSSVIGILSQRLVRILCPECKVPCEPEDMEYLNKKGLRLGKNDTPYKPLGCAHCMETGYKGRTGLFELLHIDSGIRSLIEKKAPMEEILVRAKENGMIKMKDYGWRKVKNGTTTIDEVERVLQ